jgi:hypothetical protein
VIAGGLPLKSKPARRKLPVLLLACAFCRVMGVFGMRRLLPLAPQRVKMKRHVRALYKIVFLIILVNIFLSWRGRKSSQISQRDFQIEPNAQFWLEAAAAQAASQQVDLCEDLLGMQFIKLWRSTQTPVCTETADLGACAVHPSKTGMACHVKDLIIEGAPFVGDGLIPGNDSHNSALHKRGFVPLGQPGSVKLGCSINTLPQWFRGASVQVPTSAAAKFCKHGQGCVVVSGPALIVTRLDPTNIYHHMEQYLNTFASLLVFNQSQGRNLQVFIADNFIVGPFIEDFKRLAGSPVQFLRSHKCTCFKRAFMATYSPSILTFSHPRCPSLIMLAAAHWHRNLYRDLAPSFDRSINHLRPGHGDMIGATETVRLNVVWITRHFFDRASIAGGSLSSWQQQRVMKLASETAIIIAIQQAVLEWNERTCSPQWVKWWQPKPPVSTKIAATSTNCIRSTVTFTLQVRQVQHAVL